MANKQEGVDRNKELKLVEKESASNIHNVIIALEMLRLFCEGHNDTMQNYLRE